LALIDSLADVNPDSADMLKPTPSPSLKGGEKEVWELLRIKIDDKLYRPVTHYRDTILQLVDYFEQHPRVLPRLLGKTGPALPYLYAGRVFADLGDAPQALDYYQRALDVMPDGQIENGECKTDNAIDSRVAKQRGLILSQIGEQFYFQGLYGNAVLLSVTSLLLDGSKVYI
jgi:tetratricopeptide (TPR) repeat protein